MQRINLFQILPIILLIQITLGITLGEINSKPTITFPESNTTISAELADSPSERKKGLMFRKKLPLNEGMLFVFPKEGDRGFWMKNTLIPLDIIFVDKEGRIINVEEAVPEPNTSDENLKIYTSERPAKYVVETNASFTEKKDVEEGDKVLIPSRVR